MKELWECSERFYMEFEKKESTHGISEVSKEGARGDRLV
jgi:hypothetical protein